MSICGSKEPVYARTSGVLFLKTNLLEVLEDHMSVVCVSAIPASDFEKVSNCMFVRTQTQTYNLYTNCDVLVDNFFPPS